MGNSPSQATAPGPSTGGSEDEEEKQEETSGLSMLKAGAAVAGTALLALGTWQLLSQSATRDAEDADDEDAVREAAMGGRVKSESVGNRHRIPLEGFVGPSSRGRPYTSPYLHAEDTDDEDAVREAAMGGRVKSESVGNRHRIQGPSSRGRLYTSYLRSNPNFYKILSYNVWSREDVELNQRMKALGDLIQQHSPDLICFQEVTTNIYKILKESSWWDGYQCSVPEEMAAKRSYFCMQLSKVPANFHRKRIGIPNKIRELCLAEVDDDQGRKLVFAASHLVSPGSHSAHPVQKCSTERVAQAEQALDLLKNSHSGHPVQKYSRERVAQAEQALDLLKNYSNVVFGGDMNWDEKVDGSFPLPPGWVDAWKELRPGEDGWTFDTKDNQMLSGHRPLQKRLDRFLCNLSDFSLSSIKMIGTEAINGLSYSQEKKSGKLTTLPVLPSDHYGLLLTISSL